VKPKGNAVGNRGGCANAMFDVDRPDWQQLANCRDLETNLFFPANGTESALARKMIKPFCDACPVFNQCLGFAMSFADKALQGLWANTTEGDRRRMRYSATPVGYRRNIPTT
jgi:hypothetical protein